MLLEYTYDGLNNLCIPCETGPSMVLVLALFGIFGEVCILCMGADVGTERVVEVFSPDPGAPAGAPPATVTAVPALWKVPVSGGNSVPERGR